MCKERVYDYITMTFGFCNATYAFQQLMDMVLGNLDLQCALVYIDDFNDYSKTFDQHMQDLHEVFQRLIKVDLKLKPQKCSIGMNGLV